MGKKAGVVHQERGLRELVVSDFQIRLLKIFRGPGMEGVGLMGEHHDWGLHESSFLRCKSILAAS